MTATPLQNNLKELYGLISIIDPEFFSSLDTFADQYNSVTTRDKAKFGELKGRLAHIIHRTLRNQVEEYVNFTKRTAFVRNIILQKPKSTSTNMLANTLCVKEHTEFLKGNVHFFHY